jgi:hypothetical protein
MEENTKTRDGWERSRMLKNCGVWLGNFGQCAFATFKCAISRKHRGRPCL